MKGSKPGKHQITGIPFSSKDPRYHRVWELVRRQGKTLAEALAIIEQSPSPEKKSTKKVLKKESVRKGPGGNGKIQAGDLLGNDKVPDHVKDKIRDAQREPQIPYISPIDALKNITIPLTGTLDLSAPIEAIRKEQPGSTSGPTTRMEVLVVPQEDGVAVWDITNDLATMNLLLKRNNETLVQVETLLQQVVKALTTETK
ncbi:MAG: hypothetical protein A4E42_00457 [Methanoregulaceae archaeon PtaU1.Bin222]|nr:MAG: hypothetical protein A4E42_00457 [Methanoregulaceae archaeon PtaU1.Bin222]